MVGSNNNNVIYIDNNNYDDGLDDDYTFVDEYGRPYIRKPKYPQAQSFQTAPQVLNQPVPGGVYLESTYPPSPPFEHSPLPAFPPQQQQVNIPTGEAQGGGPGEPLIIASQDFRVSLIGEDGPGEYGDIARAADNITTPYEDSRYIMDFYEREYGVPYRPFEPGIPNYTGDFGFPVVDPNPGSCRFPGFMKDVFGRCVHISYFNLPPAPYPVPGYVSGSNLPYPDPNNPYGGQAQCPPNMFLANDGRCYNYPAPPVLYPPPPSNVSGNVSGSSNFARGYPGRVVGIGGQNGGGVGYRRDDGRVMNVNKSKSLFSELTSDVGMIGEQGFSDPSKIVQVYVSQREAGLGERIEMETAVQLFGPTESKYSVNLLVPDIKLNIKSDEINVEYPGVVEVIQSDFVIPEAKSETENSPVDKDYVGEVQLWAGDRIIDRQIFSIYVF